MTLRILHKYNVPSTKSYKCHISSSLRAKTFHIIDLLLKNTKYTKNKVFESIAVKYCSRNTTFLFVILRYLLLSDYFIYFIYYDLLLYLKS